MAISENRNGVSHTVNRDHDVSCHGPFTIVFDIFIFYMPTTVTR